MNQRVLYKGTCDLCQKEIISLFDSNTPFPVYCNACWWSDKWDPIDYGQEYDFSQSFFEQFQELYSKVPWPALQTIEPSLVNSEYCNICSYLKNCYLLFNSDYSEDCVYGTYVERSKQCLDNAMIDLCELCYEGTNIQKCFKTMFSSNCWECVDVYFSRNLRGCQNCFGCINLRNKKYFIFNKSYTKDKYFKELEKFKLGSYETVEQLRKKLQELNLTYPKKYMEGLQSKNVSGDYIFFSKNIFQSFEIGGAEDCKFCQFLFISPTKDSYDFTMWGGNATQMYECMGCGGGQNNIRFSYECWSDDTMNLEYCMLSKKSCSDLFGCVALGKKSHCILNKQYDEDSFKKLRTKIIQHTREMPYKDKRGRTYTYGEFLSPDFSVFAYNESFVYEHFPLTKKQALEQGYSWKDLKERGYEVTAEPQDLPDHIKDVQDDILKKVIGCQHQGKCNEQCTTAFKIIPQELQFYKKMNLPLPRFCPNCRHYQRLKQRNPLKLWHRECQCAGGKSDNKVYKNAIKHFHGSNHCPNEFETTYSPKRKEIVYCEKCYQQEVV
ncbi:hypothetical protein MYX06_00030 [Patescibacteria group bacterium AH-259-L05]|nr:hypothetical protein [Patescibacteria group bacterium AH-259-L05]